MRRKGHLFHEALPIKAILVALCSTGCYSSSTSIGGVVDAGTDSGLRSVFVDDRAQVATPVDMKSDSEQVDAQDHTSNDPSNDPTTNLPTDRLDAGSLDSGRGYVFPESSTSQPDTGITPTTPVSEYDAGDIEFSGGVPPGERAPALGEVPGNVYGEPSVPPGPYDWGMPECSIQANGRRSTGSENQCVGYTLCTVECYQDSDCDNGGSGNAIPRCNLDGLFFWTSEYGSCELVCDSDTVCPEGMVCVNDLEDVDGSICMWPTDLAEPGCPAWCELDPVPKDCPDWCAVAGVGCDTDVDGYCCEGLVCGSEGWCVEE